MAASHSSPRTEYQARLASHRERADALASRQSALSNGRLAVFLIGVAGAAAVFGTGALPGATLTAPLLGFVALVLWHDRVIDQRDQADRAVHFYEAGLARLDGAWAGTGVAGDDFLDPHHPYAADLDLFGRGSLFELLCTARTIAGEARLAGWLCAAAGPDEIRERHAAVEELRPRLDLRESLALLGEDVRAGLHPADLERWASQPPLPTTRAWRRIAALLSVASAVSLFGWFAGFVGFEGIGPLPFLAVLALEGGVALRWRKGVNRTLVAVEQPTRDLALLSELLERISREPFASPRLAELATRLAGDGRSAWREIARLERLVGLADARRNQFFFPIAAVLLWSTQTALAIEEWRQRSALDLADWLEAIGEIEALGSLASHAYENPADPFPEVVEAGPVLDGEGLGHPLLPRDGCIRNDVRLDGDHAVYVVSGSNMSGKSTFLRTVGANAVLALAGAPVRGTRLRISSLAVGASIRVHDSLQDGESRFYAEIKRLRQIMDLARDEAHPLFLLDEILHGTNSHDRQIGAAAVVQGLVERGAVGLVTTHDLALSSIADALSPRATNVHFEDHLEGGVMHFDYSLREGVVEKSNALELMRSVGLDV
jgi:hypothetical protein